MKSAQSVRIHGFHGGIHPAENKLQSVTRPLSAPPLPAELVIPVTQPGFREAEILVSPGEHVLKGQLIARGKEAMGISCHASTSGTVAAIGPHAVPVASGLPELCITLHPDGMDTWVAHEGTPDYASLDRSTLLSRIADAGISGLGGAGFPSHIKLSVHPDRISTLIINACECEPFITADDMLMREHADEVVTGIRILMQILSPQQCLIGIEDNKPEAIAAMQAAIGDTADILVKVVPSKYPSGSEKQLITLLTGEEVPSGGLPASLGIVCHNTGTARAIKRAICDGEALVSRIVTLTGAALATPCNLEVRIGTPIPHLLAHCGVDRASLSRVIMGGSLMGVSLPTTEAPVIKITNCLIATTEAELPRPAPAQACIRCGMCTDACPAKLLPQQLYWFARSKEHDKAREHNIFDCIECGACAWVCPSNIPLVQYYRAEKAEIREEDDKHLKGEISQKRYEYHQQRMEKEKALQEERRRQRAELARRKKAEAEANAFSAEDTIQAALERVKAKKAARTAHDQAEDHD